MYVYENEKQKALSEECQKDFLKVRDTVKELLKQAGAFTMESALKNVIGSVWTQMAFVDRLVEIGEIKELTINADVSGQHRIFVSADY